MNAEPPRSTESLAEKRSVWLDCLAGKDRNSISNQLHQMIWDAAAFRIINDARLLAPLDEDGIPKLSGLVHGLLNRTFFVTQAAAIRRLTDAKNPRKKRSVLSLTSLITDIEKNTSLLTREAIFAAEELPYDFGSIQAAKSRYAAEQTKAGKAAWHTPPDLVWERYADRHSQLDRLCGIKDETRKRTDSIRSEILENLKTRLADVCEDVRLHVDKFIAHAATPESRECADRTLVDLTLSHLWTAHSVLGQVASFVSVYILGSGSRAFLGPPSFDQFEHLEKPLVERAQIDQLRDVWDNFEKETRAWAIWGLDEFEDELGPLAPVSEAHAEGDTGRGDGRGMSKR